MIRFLAVFLGAAFLFSGCERKEVPFDPSAAVYSKISGKNAFVHVEKLVEIGPRPAGSEGLEDARFYITTELEKNGWKVQRQAFEKLTPDGKVNFVNLRARFGDDAWKKNPVGILCSHYDTKKFAGFEFVGANDAGSSTGLLIEIGRVLAMKPDLAGKIELVFFDGEEAFGPEITQTDGLYGSRYYAGEMIILPQKNRPKWGVLLDMVGDKDLNVRAAVQILNSTIRELKKAKESGHDVDIEKVKKSVESMSKDLLSAANDLDVRSEIGISPDFIIDDHIPLNTAAGIPTINLIDFDYGTNWHTPGDTLDKISAVSLETVGKVTVLLVEKYLKK